MTRKQMVADEAFRLFFFEESESVGESPIAM